LEVKLNQSESRTPIVRLISFGDGTPGIKKALGRVKAQGIACGLIDSVETFNYPDLGEEFQKKFGDIVTEFTKGFGLWSWKPFLVDRELQRLNEGDILIYCDAGVEINPQGSQILAEYLDYVARKGFLFFSVGHQNRFWTKPDADLLDLENYFRNQVSATVFLMKVSSESKSLAAKWLEICERDSASFLKDPEEHEIPSWSSFRGHRHDQSLLSKVVYDFGLETKRDETFFTPWRQGRKYPFLALRNKQTGISWLPMAFWLPGLLFYAWRMISLAFVPEVRRSRTQGLIRRLRILDRFRS
jgi:hypothetical protein